MTYTYDASGQRITKRGPQGETGYINQWMTLRNGEVGTKHVFAGTSRVVSKLVKQDKPNTKRNSSNNKKNGQGKARIVYEKDQYYYHPDHLGSTAYITHTNGQIYQHLEYFPFGETWVEEHSNKQRTPYLFTAKELDEETGLYYFGARYYDPRTSVWQSTDPILNDYIGEDPKNLSSQGVFDPKNIALYLYSSGAPVTRIDPDGRDDVVVIYGGFHKPIADNPYGKLEGGTGSSALAESLAKDHAGKSVKILPFATGGNDSKNISAGMDFVKQHHDEGDAIAIYGYSRGGDPAVGLAESLGSEGKSADLLITVDSYKPDSSAIFAIGAKLGKREWADNIAKTKTDADTGSFFNFYQTNSKGQHGAIFEDGALNIKMEDAYHSDIDEKASGYVRELINQKIGE